MPSRFRRVRGALARQGVAGLIVTDPPSVRWLTGFTGSNGLLFVDAESAILITDGRYGDQAPQELAAAGVDAEVRVTNAPVDELTSLVCGREVAVEADHLTWAEHRSYATAFGTAPVAFDTALVALRAVKDGGELDRVRAAAAITDAALAEVVGTLAASTEREVALALDHLVRTFGASGNAYETIVASGPNAALPHARPTDRRLGRGDLVIIDVGSLYDGYRSDMTRTFVIGEASEEHQRWLDVVLDAQRAGVAAARPGVATRDVDAACREVIAAAGWADAFNHGAGHGVGLDIHERPRVSSRTDDVLEAGMLVTVEPGVYFAGSGGVRWEDLHLVTATGLEALTHSPKDPLA